MRTLLTEADNTRSIEVFLFAVQSIIQRLRGVIDNTLEQTAYTAFQEVTSNPHSDVVSLCIKILGISGKSKKQYATSLIALLLEIVSTVE
jgi:hypothetical protein